MLSYHTINLRSVWSSGCLQKIWQGRTYWSSGLLILPELEYRVQPKVMGRFWLNSRHVVCLWYCRVSKWCQSNEWKGCGCSPTQVQMLNVPEDKQRSGSSLELIQRLPNLHRELESPQTGRMLSCPVLLEEQNNCWEETCLLCSPAWVGRRPGLLGTLVDSHPSHDPKRAEHWAVTAPERWAVCVQGRDLVHDDTIAWRWTPCYLHVLGHQLSLGLLALYCAENYACSASDGIVCIVNVSSRP